MGTASSRTQSFPPGPTFTEKDVAVGSHTGKVFIVTGGNQGVGLELIKILYPTGATIYLASRSEERGLEAIKEVISSDPPPTDSSRIKLLHLDLNDLDSVRKAAKTFADQESRLDILWNNAGIGAVPAGSKTEQGIEMHLGVNVVGPLLLSQLLIPQLQTAAASSPKDSVRVIWTSSLTSETMAPPGGFSLEDFEKGGTSVPLKNYAASKAAVYPIAIEFGARVQKDGIISIAQNPGNLRTNAYRTMSKLMMFFINLILYPAKMGAYTELFAGLSGEITQDLQNAYIVPWGRIEPRHPRKDICEAIENGKGKELWDWCIEQIKPYM